MTAYMKGLYLIENKEEKFMIVYRKSGIEFLVI